ncbi:AraC family transcriptional regulator [Clostridiaceae bacterium M8S5]|nr:AraC family transcriptional regulator [Clostridiaceae bacterium M8S5]
MNYSEDIRKSINFIEVNIKEKITPQMISNHIGYSKFHFCRVFHICMEQSVMEYIRKRRLSLSAIELFRGNKIVDIAFDYCFETHSGFSKAFKKEFGYTPTQYIKRMAWINSYKEGYDSVFDIGGYNMEPKIIQKDSFKVAGYGIKTNIEDSTYTKDIAAFWDNYDTNGWECKMYKQLNPLKHGEVGICINNEEDNVTYLLGVIVNNFNKVTDDMITIEVPEAKYAVFTTPPVDTSGENKSNNEFPQAIRQTWKYIFEEWFKDSGYVYDDTKMDFEFYDERCHFRPDTVMEIYIPIKNIDA